MGHRTYKPITPGRRHMQIVTRDEITADKPEKSLVRGKRRINGRNNTGRVMMRHRGGGHKRRYRLVDFRRDKDEVKGKVATIEYDPNRSARIALLHYVDGDKRYILAPDGMKVGDKIVSSRHADIKPGNSLTLRYIPLGTTIHNVELRKGKGEQRSTQNDR